MASRRFFTLPSRRRLLILAAIVLLPSLAYWLWTPGKVVVDGRHDLGHNGLWMTHAFLGDDAWFKRNKKAHLLPVYRDPEYLTKTAALYRQHHLTDLFPHLCPAELDGHLPPHDAAQVERVLDAFPAPEFRVLPWVGGVSHGSVRLEEATWRKTFAQSCKELLVRHPRLAGGHLNIEPLPSGNADFLALLDELRAALGPGKKLSVAAYPPPSMLHRFPEVHWEEAYYRQVARRSDQMAVMLYDTGLHNRRLYQNLIRSWTRDVLAWAGPTPVLLGVPAYEDADSGYHDPAVENIAISLPAMHAGLEQFSSLPANYQGVAVYSDWEMTEAKWRELKTHFSHP